jgi:F-type H+-transporting ATPase subunit alpha
MSVEDQVVIIYCGTKNLLRRVPVEKVKEFEKELVSYMRAKHADVMEQLRLGKFTDELTNAIEAAAKELTAKYS